MSAVWFVRARNSIKPLIEAKAYIDFCHTIDQECRSSRVIHLPSQIRRYGGREAQKKPGSSEAISQIRLVDRSPLSLASGSLHPQCLGHTSADPHAPNDFSILAKTSTCPPQSHA